MTKILTAMKNVCCTALIFTTLTFWISGAIASDELIVEVSPSLVVVYPPADVSNLHSVMLRVVAPDGALVTEDWSGGEVISWTPVDLDDGLYRYEVVVYVDDPDGASAEETVSSEPVEEHLQALNRAWGVLDVSNGTIIVPQPKSGGDEQAAVLPAAKNIALRTIGWILDAVMPVAHAQDLTASSVVPTVNMVDSNSPGGARNVVDILAAESSVSPCTNATTDIVFEINAVGNSSADMISVCSRGANANNTMIVDPAGDISFANGAAFIDRSANRLGIGTTTPLEGLHIQSTAPGIRLDSPSVVYDIQENADDLSFFIVTNSGAGEPTGEAFTLEDTNGFFGMWQANPSAPLHVQSPSGQNASILVQNPVAPPAGDVVMFNLANLGSNIVRFLINAGGSSWSFDNDPNVNPGAGVNSGLFRISKVGTFVVEFSVNGFGDGFFRRNSFAVNHINTSSREVKTDFTPIDEKSVLAKLIELPITMWRYRAEDSNIEHIGPVAEDFQSTFGLSDGKHISTVDANGVALAAIKGLHQTVEERNRVLEQEIQTLKLELNTKDRQLQALIERMAALETMFLGEEKVGALKH